MKFTSNLGPLGQFAAKALIVAVIVMGSLSILLFEIDTIVSERLGATHFSGKVFWSKLEAELEKAADPANDLPPERKAKLLAAVRTLSERWGPFLTEATAGLSAGSPRQATDEKK